MDPVEAEQRYKETVDAYEAPRRIMEQLRMPYLLITPFGENGVVQMSNMDMNWQDILLFRTMLSRISNPDYKQVTPIVVPGEGGPAQ